MGPSGINPVIDIGYFGYPAAFTPGNLGRNVVNGIPLIVAYHPAALLRNPNWKKPTWDDVRIARQLLDR